MTTYAEKLKDPRWQRRRLEKLQHVGWMCEACCDSANTLHVHHPRYFKGREPWEYANSELQVLCVRCHSEHHEREAAVAEAFSATGAYGREFSALIVGYMQLSPGGDSSYAAQLIRVCEPSMTWLGSLAALLQFAPAETQREIWRHALTLDNGPVFFAPAQWKAIYEYAGLSHD